MSIKNQSEIKLIFNKKLEIKNLIFTNITTLPLYINDKITPKLKKQQILKIVQIWQKKYIIK